MCKSVRYCQFPLIIFWAGSALQSWQWWPCCPSWRGHACWALCRSLCGLETRRRCSCWGASSPWTCTRHGRLSGGGGDKETDIVHFNVPRRFETVMKRFWAVRQNIGLNLDYTHGRGGGSDELTFLGDIFVQPPSSTVCSQRCTEFVKNRHHWNRWARSLLKSAASCTEPPSSDVLRS